MATIGELAGSIAHEVAQPIAATVANAAAALAWLSPKPPDLDEVRSARARIVRNANRAGQVIGRIRSLVRKEPPWWDSPKINDVTREVIGAHPWRSGEECHLADRRGRRGIASYSRRSGPAATGMLNLIINAVEAMPGVDEASRELRINTEHAEQGGVLTAVQDSGPGLAPAALERLFDAFYTTKPGGTGAGLSICPQSSRLMAGDYG